MEKNTDLTTKAKGNASGKKKKVTEEEMHSMQVKSEIAGTIWITMGVLLGLSIYVIAQSPFGKAVSSLLFGLIGAAAYLVPILCILVGVLLFFRNKFKVRISAFVIIGIYAFLILCIINTNAVASANISYFKFLANSFKLSAANHWLGGFLGSIISFPLLKLFTRIGANVVFLAGIVILTIIAFKVSIAEMVSDIISKIKTEIEKSKERDERRKKYYNDDEDDEPDEDFGRTAYDNGSEVIDSKRERPIPPSKADINCQSEHLIINEEESIVELDFDALLKTGMNEPIEQSDAEQVEQMPDNVNPITGEIIEPKVPAYQRPPYSLLQRSTADADFDTKEAKLMSELLINAFASYHVSVRISAITVGPTITRFEIQPAEGVKISKITELEREIKMALAVEKIRIEAPIPGKNAIGIEIPNKNTTFVYLRDIIEESSFVNAKSHLTIAIGKDIVGQNVIADIAKMPHLMIAGSTGSGKSVCMNTIILSLIYKSSPEDIRLILIDPKKVEFSVYKTLPHLLIPVVTDEKKAASALKWAVAEMSTRYNQFAERNVRQIDGFNATLDENEQKMPRIVIIIDELAELMMSAPKDVEDSITRIAQLGRACGIHLVVATQRPSVDIITGKIKANIISRIAFAVSDLTNSKVILDGSGAENLIGNGDMLFHPLGVQKAKRVQCAFVADEEVVSVVDFFVQHNMRPDFDIDADESIEAGVSEEPSQVANEKRDALLYEAARWVVQDDRPSTSYIQNKLNVGYNRADRMITSLERLGIVSPADYTKKREVLVSMEQLEELHRKQII